MSHDARARTAARRFGVALFVASVLFIIRATLVGESGAVPTPHVTDWCFACSSRGYADATLNVMLFVPLGISLSLLGVTTVRAFLIGAAASIAIEYSQRMGFPVGRVSNITDVVTNSTGAALGAFVAATSDGWLRPTDKGARMLSLGGTGAASALLAFSAFALGRAGPTIGDATVRVATLSTGTGFGWYHGRVLGGSVGATHFDAPIDGPLVLDGALRARDSVSVQVASRDERPQFVPALFMRPRENSKPTLMLGQHGEDARLVVRLRAHDLRLAPPELEVPRAFAADKNGSFELGALIDGGTYSLFVQRDGVRSKATLSFTVGLGWTLFQTVLGAQSIMAPFMSALWLLALTAPLGFWAAHARTRAVAHWLMTIGALVAVGTVAPRLAGNATTGLADWFFLATGLALGAAIMRWTNRRAAAGTSAPIS